ICKKRPHEQTSRHYCSAPCCGNERPAPSPSPTRRGRHLHCVSAHRLDDILYTMATERVVTEIELVLLLLVDGLRDANRPRLGERLEPGGDVDAIAKDVVPIDND